MAAPLNKMGAGFSWPDNGYLTEPPGWNAVDIGDRPAAFDVMSAAYNALSASVLAIDIRHNQDYSLAVDFYVSNGKSVTLEIMSAIASLEAHVIGVEYDFSLRCSSHNAWVGALVVFVRTSAHVAAYPSRSVAIAAPSSAIATVSASDEPDTITFKTDSMRWFRHRIPGGVTKFNRSILSELGRIIISLQGARVPAAIQRIFEITNSPRTYQICTSGFLAPLTMRQIHLVNQLAHKERVHIDCNMEIDGHHGALVFTCQLPALKHEMSDSSIRRPANNKRTADALSVDSGFDDSDVDDDEDDSDEGSDQSVNAARVATDLSLPRSQRNSRRNATASDDESYPQPTPSLFGAIRVPSFLTSLFFK